MGFTPGDDQFRTERLKVFNNEQLQVYKQPSLLGLRPECLSSLKLTLLELELPRLLAPVDSEKKGRKQVSC